MRLTIPLAALLVVMSCTPVADIAPIPLPAPAARVPAPVSTVSPVTVALPSVPSPAVKTGTGDILVLGDSQISFGAGGAYTAFFSNLAANCGNVVPRFRASNSAAIGVRSTALHHWTTTDAGIRAPLCDIDPKFGVNAGAYGVTSKGRTYVQIGQDPAYPFCPEERSALKAVFDAPGYTPELVVFAFLGNATDRWQSTATARADWNAAAAQLPADVACIAMTTIPSFEGPTNAKRRTAQSNLAAAVNASGRCAFVAGFTDKTLATFQSNPTHFRTDDAGTVTDPRHPTSASAQRFVDLQRPALCAALARVLPE